MSGHEIKKEDAPVVVLLVSSIVALAAIVLMSVSSLTIVERSDLYQVSGVIEKIQIVRDTHPEKIDVYISGDKGSHHLTQERCLTELSSLKRGQRMTAKVRPDKLFRDIEWIWSVRSGGSELLSYRDVLGYKEEGAKKDWVTGIVVLVIGILGMVLAVFLRRSMGAWSSEQVAAAEASKLYR